MILFVFGLILISFLVKLQCHLAKSPGKLRGLFLPSVSFLFSVFFCSWFGISCYPSDIYIVQTSKDASKSFDAMSAALHFIREQNNEWISFAHAQSLVSTNIFLLRLLVLFLCLNVLTIAFFIIYRHFKKTKHTQEE